MRPSVKWRARRSAAPVLMSLAALVVAVCASERNERAATSQSVVAPTINWQQTYGPTAAPSVIAVAYAPDGASVATTHADMAVNIWRASDGALLHSNTRPGYSCGGTATGLAYSPDSQLVAAADGCATRLIAVATGTLVRKIGATGRVAFSPDGAYIASTFQTAYNTRTTKLWRVLDGALVWSVTGGGNQIAFAPDGTLATVNRDGIEFWDVATGAKLRTFAGPTTALAFSPDSQLVAAAGAQGGEYPYDATISIFRVGDGTLVRQLTRTGDVWTMRFTPDGQYLMSGGQDTNYERVNGYVASTNTIRLWRLGDGLAFKTYDLGTDYPGFGGLAVAPDSQSFAYAVGATTYLAQSPPPTQCTYSITPTSASFERDGGDATVTVNTQAGCPWTARSRVSWTSIKANASGTGPGTVTYNVAPDTESASGITPYYVHAVIVVADQTFAIHQNIVPAGPSYFKIYGQISDGACLNAVSGVTVTLTGYSSATTTTDANGNYSFADLLGGQNYTVTPSKTGYVFSPSSKTISSLASDTSVYFTTTTNPAPLPSIRGRVADAGGAGLYNVQVQLTGGLYPRTAYTISNGNYSFGCLEPGYNYTVTPTSTTYGFAPASRTYNSLTTAQTGADFVAGSKPITISGHVTSAGQPLAGVLVQFADDGQISTATTDGAGYYSHTVAASGYHDVTPSKDGYTFTPQVANFVDPSSDQTADFAGRPSCAFTLAPQSQDAPASGGTFKINVATSSACSWAATSNNTDWITVVAGAQGGGSGPVTYAVAPNASNEPRAGSLTVAGQTFTVTQATGAPSPVLISEFRLNGPRGARDEYVELYNNTDDAVTVSAADGSSGWTLAALDPAGGPPAAVCTVPNGATIPPRGHYLIGNVDAALSGVPAPASAFDVTYTGDIGDDRGLALFRTAAPEHLTTAYKLDAVSFATQTTAAAARPSAQGQPPAAESVSSEEQYAYVRRVAQNGAPQATGDGSQDFVLVSTTGTVAGQPVQLGSPAPEGSGGLVQINSLMKSAVLERLVSVSDAPNRARDTTPVANGAQGTLVIRRRFTNRTGEAVTRLRFRIVDITTLNSPDAGGGQADLRAIDSPDVQLTTPGGGVLTVRGTTVDQSLPQNAGGGLNSAFVVALPGGGLAPGDSVNVQFALGVQTTGNFRFLVSVEALTGPQTGATPTAQKGGQTFK